MTKLASLLAAAVALGASAMPAGAQSADRAALQALAGTFHSPAVEEWYGGYGTREFVFADGRWSLTFVHALDPAMTRRTFAFRTGGAYVVGAESEVVPGAYHTIFDEDWKHVTLLTPVPEIAAAMGLAACGLVVNLEADVSETGCGPWKSVAACGEDHDLLAMTREGLHFGVRPADNDMCSADRTPTALLPAVVAR